MKLSLTLVLSGLSLLLAAQCPTVVWEDEFDGTTLDQTKWSYQLGDGCPDLCGWGNSELQWYQEENVEVGEGTLKIIAKRDQGSEKEYTSARIRSINKGDWTYGRFEASMKLPQGRGLWPAFWMLPTDNVYGGWPQSGEIDIMELIGQEPEIVHGTIHFGKPWPNNRFSGEEYELLSGIFNDQFHTFAVEWEANTIRWFVDDYLYATKRRNDVSPERWPFDQDFHFLLNIAIGGTWPGNPFSSTPFPQTMEVEYVRVYDGFLPYVTGARKVANQAQNVGYSLKNLSQNATVNWQVPDGAAIVSGQGTANVRVNWNDLGGTLRAEIQDDCTTKTIALEVAVAPPFAKSLSFENFDEEGRVQLGNVTGQFEDGAANPSPNNINGSDLCGKYTRNAGESFDVFFYSINNLGNVASYLEGEEKFYIDLYTDAPVGTTLLLQLENSRQAAPENYPTGRHSRFEVKTTKQNEWERLEFQLLDRPDGSVGNTLVDQFVLLFAPNTSTDNTYYFDNFDKYAPSLISTEAFFAATATGFKLSPNPASTNLTVENTTSETIAEWQILDTTGRIIQRIAQSLPAAQTTTLELEKLPSGNYLIQAVGAKGTLSAQQLVIQH